MTEMHVKAISQIVDCSVLIWVIYNFIRGMVRGPLTEGFRLAGFIFGGVLTWFFNKNLTNWFVNSLKWPVSMAAPISITLIFFGVYLGFTYLGMILTWAFTRGGDEKSPMSLSDRMLGGLVSLVTASVIAILFLVAPLALFENMGFNPAKYSYSYKYTRKLSLKLFTMLGGAVNPNLVSTAKVGGGSSAGSNTSGNTLGGMKVTPSNSSGDSGSKPLSMADIFKVYNVVSQNPDVAMQAIMKDPAAQKLLMHPKIRDVISDKELIEKVRQKGPMVVMDPSVMARVNEILTDPEIAKLFRNIDWEKIKKEIEAAQETETGAKSRNTNTKTNSGSGGGLFDWFK